MPAVSHGCIPTCLPSGARKKLTGVPRPYWRSKPISVVELHLDPPDRGASLSESRLRARATPTCRRSTAPGHGPAPNLARSWLLDRRAGRRRRRRGRGRSASRAGVPSALRLRCGVRDRRSDAAQGPAAYNKVCHWWRYPLSGGCLVYHHSVFGFRDPCRRQPGQRGSGVSTRCRPPSLPYSGARCLPGGVRYSTSVIRSPASRSPSSVCSARLAAVSPLDGRRSCGRRRSAT